MQRYMYAYVYAYMCASMFMSANTHASMYADMYAYVYAYVYYILNNTNCNMDSIIYAYLSGMYIIYMRIYRYAHH